MNRFSFILMAVLLACPLMAFSKNLDLRINGIGMDSSYSLVIKNLGKPISKKVFGPDGDDDCLGNAKTMDLKYQGLEISLISDQKGKNFKVYAIKVTSSKWVPSKGVRVGIATPTLSKLLGKPLSRTQDKGNEVLEYSVAEGESAASFTFKKGALKSIYWGYSLC